MVNGRIGRNGCFRNVYYPVENHGFTEETSWADEYERILKLFEDNLRLKREAGNRAIGSSGE